MKKTILMLALFVMILCCSTRSAAEADFLAPNLNTSDYNQTELLFAPNDWQPEKKHPYININQIQVVQVGESTSDVTAYNPIENEPLITLKVAITAKQVPLTVSPSSLSTMSGSRNFRLIDNYSEVDEDMEIKPGDTKEMILTFASKKQGIDLQDLDVVRLHNYIRGGDETADSIIIPVSESGKKMAANFNEGIYPDQIQREAIFQKNVLADIDYDQKQTIPRVANFHLMGLEVSELEDANVHSSADIITSNVQTGKLSLTFPISVTSLSEEKRLFLANPKLRVNDTIYPATTQFSRPATFVTLDEKDAEKTAYLVFVLDKAEWAKADTFQLSLGPVHSTSFNALYKSTLMFQLDKGDEK